MHHATDRLTNRTLPDVYLVQMHRSTCFANYSTPPPFFPIRRSARIDRGGKIFARSGPPGRGGIISGQFDEHCQMSSWIVESTRLMSIVITYDSSYSQTGNLPMKTVIQLRASQSVKPTVRGGRAKNAAYRQREYLTEAEIEKLVSAAGDSRNPVRDRLLILIAFRHALRVSELVNLRWQQIHLDTATIHITRAKNGTPGNHGLQGDELRLLRALRREHPHADFVFLSERKSPLSVGGAQKLIERLGEAAKLPSRSMLTCCGMPPATPWRAVASTRGRFRLSWGIARSRTPSSTRR
jgi:type 1 fimbriae regulatory protein FimB/type 1 fimbriae regulatory protein FimE